MTKIEAPKLAKILEDARQEQNRTLEDIAAQLNLSVEQLDFFEKADYELQDLSPFQRGYLRNYLTLLSLDPMQWMPEQENRSSELLSMQDYNDFKDHKPLLTSRWFKVIFVVGVLVAALYLFTLWWPEVSVQNDSTKASEVPMISLPAFQDSAQNPTNK